MTIGVIFLSTFLFTIFSLMAYPAFLLLSRPEPKETGLFDPMMISLDDSDKESVTSDSDTSDSDEESDKEDSDTSDPDEESDKESVTSDSDTSEPESKEKQRDSLSDFDHAAKELNKAWSVFRRKNREILDGNPVALSLIGIMNAGIDKLVDPNNSDISAMIDLNEF